MGADVRLLSVDAVEESRALRGCLEGLGYQVREWTGGSWLDAPVSDTRPTVAYFDPNRMDRAVCSGISSRLDPASLLAVFPSGDPVQRDLLCLCAELAFWPCPGRELEHRLTRLHSRRQVADAGVGNPHLESFRRLNLIGHSAPFQGVLARVQQVSGCDVPVLLQGETGTGKEMVARAIHYLGPRQDSAFVPVNCGAIPPALIESELFGHARGAFTDAKAAQTGLVELADKGTLFLDEIDSLSPQGQVSLLRFLQNQEFRPVGGRQFKTVDVRLLVAGNRSLKTLVAEGDFREDLYYRLNLFTVELPPLRERGDDCVTLANQFLKRYGKRYERGQQVLSGGALAWLRHYHWPGNVRELENAVHRACLTNIGEQISARDLSGETRPDYAARSGLEDPEQDMSLPLSLIHI